MTLREELKTLGKNITVTFKALQKTETFFNAASLMTRKQMNTLHANQVVRRTMPLAFDFDKAAARLSARYPEKLAPLSFIETDTGTLIREGETGIAPYARDLMRTAAMDEDMRKSFHRPDTMIGMSYSQSSQLYDTIMHDCPDDMDPGLIPHLIFNHETGHAMSSLASNGWSDTLIEENFADTFAMLQLETDMPGHPHLAALRKAWSNLRATSALLDDDIIHHTCFTLDMLETGRCANAIPLTAEETVIATHAHLERFIPDKTALDRFKKNADELKNAIKTFPGGCDRKGAMGLLLKQITTVADAAGTPDYDPCFAYTAAKVVKAFFTDGINIAKTVTTSREKVFTDALIRALAKETVRMTAPLAKDPFFSKYNLCSLHILPEQASRTHTIPVQKPRV